MSKIAAASTQPPPDTRAPFAGSTAETNSVLYQQMHSERDHYWPSGGIPPHRDTSDQRLQGAEPRAQYQHSHAFMSGDITLVPERRSDDVVGENLGQSTAAIGMGGSRERQLLNKLPARDEGALQDIRQGSTQAAAPFWSQSLKNSIAGAGAGAVSSIVTCPLDVVKTRLQYQGVLQEKYRRLGHKPYRGTFSTLERIAAEEGVRGLYRGLAPMLMGYLPTWGIYFAAYEGLKAKSSQALGYQPGHAAVHVVSAMGAGATTSLLTNPVWVLKSRFMTQSAFTDYQYTSMWHAVKVIQAHEGWMGFYKGLGTSLLGVTHVAVQFPLYEQLKAVLNDDPTHQLASSRILLASAISKMFASSVTYPHEVIRTRLQNQSTHPPKYRGIAHAVRLIYKEEGVSAFYRGLSTNLIRTVPASMMTLLTYELLIRML